MLGFMGRKFGIKTLQMALAFKTCFISSLQSCLTTGPCYLVELFHNTSQQKLAAQNSVLNNHLHLCKRIRSSQLLDCLSLNLHPYGSRTSAGRFVVSSGICVPVDGRLLEIFSDWWRGASLPQEEGSTTLIGLACGFEVLVFAVVHLSQL